MHHVVGLAEAIVNRRISGLEILLVFLLLTVVVNRRIGGLEIICTFFTCKNCVNRRTGGLENNYCCYYPWK